MEDNSRVQSNAMPQLSQEKLKKIMNMVKNKELSIQGALELAEKEKGPEEEGVELNDPLASQDFLTATQFNFIIRKYKRYRWQKRILQIDLNTKTIFNIENGIIRKQFPFSQIKYWESGEGTRFNIAFHGRRDYELEATSLEDKRKLMHLLDKILCKSVESPSGQIDQQDGAVHDGLLELEQNSLEAAKWVKCLVQLHKRHLTLYPLGFNEENEKTNLEANQVQLSDVRVHKENEHDEFSVQTKKNNYLFRIPATALIRQMKDVTEMRDKWVTLISQYCAPFLTYPDHQAEFQDGSSCAEISLTSKREISKDGPDILPGGKEKESLSLLATGSSTTSLSMVPTSSCMSGSQRRISMGQGTAGVPQPCIPLVQGGPLLSASLPAVNPIPATERTKAFHWDIVPHDKILKSIWSTCDLQKRKIDVTRLYDQFRALNTPVMLNNDFLGNQHLLLDYKVAHNFSIFLRHFHLKPKELQGRLYILQEEAGGLACEHITTLRKYVPTIKDIEMYHSYQGSPSELHLVDQFMLELSLLRGKERKFTLVHALVEQILLHQPHLAKFPQELTEFEAAPGASIKGLKVEVDVLRKELEKIIQYKKILKPKSLRPSEQENQFHQDLKDLIQKYKEDLCQLSKRCDEMKKLYGDILEQFGERPDQDSQELFGWISAFVRDFRKAQADLNLQVLK
ncbi:uncharacterized protein LOC114032499 [Vombatus ursinus]|uniref:uncharacterized protein LOC114032499 n=1 Tax=Vombatus ursinus TaxID=29139 RepID=UPI000FFD9EBE|nr:uncharacterized protein LOC114032499 [Vombatus ursinus]